MLGLMTGPVGVGEAVVLVLVAVPVDVAVPLVVLLLPGRPGAFWYMLRRLPSPQYSVELPLQTMLHWLWGTEAALPRISLPQKHSPPYSRPAYLKFCASQVLMQLATVRGDTSYC